MSLVTLILLLVLAGAVVRLTARRDARLSEPPDASREELRAVREQLEEMSTRLARLEEERDFYRELLDAPDRERLLDAAEERDRPPSR